MASGIVYAAPILIFFLIFGAKGGYPGTRSFLEVSTPVSGPRSFLVGTAPLGTPGPSLPRTEVPPPPHRTKMVVRRGRYTSCVHAGGLSCSYFIFHHVRYPRRTLRRGRFGRTRCSRWWRSWVTWRPEVTTLGACSVPPSSSSTRASRTKCSRSAWRSIKTWRYIKAWRLIITWRLIDASKLTFWCSLWKKRSYNSFVLTTNLRVGVLGTKRTSKGSLCK